MRGMPILSTAALVVNLLAGAVFAYNWWPRSVMVEIRVAMQYTELERARIINEEALFLAFPALASNSRNLVPKYIAGEAVSSLRATAQGGLALAVLNCVAFTLVIALALRANKPGVSK